MGEHTRLVEQAREEVAWFESKDWEGESPKRLSGLLADLADAVEELQRERDQARGLADARWHIAGRRLNERDTERARVAALEAEVVRLTDGIRGKCEWWDGYWPAAQAHEVTADFRSLLDVAGDEPPSGYVRLSDYHVDGCVFTADDGWTCKPGCPSGEGDQT